MPATKADRFGAYLLDFFLPLLFMGAIVAAFFDRSPETTLAVTTLFGAYLLFRDVPGASLGKLALRLRVVGESPLGASISGRVLRNVPLAAPWIFGNLAQYFDSAWIAGGVSLLFLIDVFFFLQQGRRLGDIIAGTSVVRRG